MFSNQSALVDLKNLEQLSNGTSAIHRLDARAKVLVTLIFILCVVSYDRYELAALLPFFIFPAAMISLSGIPPRIILRKIALLCPFVLAVGAFNPVFDRTIIMQFGPVSISGGWVSFASILVRSIITVGAAFILIGTTGFTSVCLAFERFGLPRIFAVQLLFLYRYIFILGDESSKTARARELRSCGKKGLGIASFSSMVGHLLLRTWQRAERIHSAMLSRGFIGRFHDHRKTQFGKFEFGFVLGWLSLFIVLRSVDLPGCIGRLFTGVFP
jgi:cobalt/nickel transport system permease protein